MLWYEGGELMGDGDDSGGDSSDDIYNGKTKPVLVSVSDSYSEDVLTTLSTNYCLKKSVNDFVLRRTFYSKQLF